MCRRKHHITKCFMSSSNCSTADYFSAYHLIRTRSTVHTFPNIYKKRGSVCVYLYIYIYNFILNIATDCDIRGAYFKELGQSVCYTFSIYVYSLIYIIYTFSCSIASNCNKQKYQAKRAGEQSIELYLTVYIGLHSPLVAEAVVMDVKDLSFDVIVCSTGQVQRIYTNVSTTQSTVLYT